MTKTGSLSQNPHWLECTDKNWFVAQTNYDWWEPQPSSDNRLGLAIENLLSLGRTVGSSQDGLFTTMSLLGNSTTRGVLNSKTIFTTIIDPLNGHAGVLVSSL